MTNNYGLHHFSPEWPLCRVGDICTSIVPGRAKPLLSTDGDVPWLTIDDLDVFYLYESQRGFRASIDELTKIGGKVIPSGSVIMSCVGKFGIVGIAQTDVVINQQLHAFVCPSSLEPYFLATVLQMQKPVMERVATKTTVSYMNKAACESIPIPLPPLHVQRKITQILTNWDSAVARVKQLIAALQLRKKALMQQLLTGHMRFPEFDEPWHEVALSQFLRYTPRKVAKPTVAYTRMGIRSHGKGTFTEIVDDPNSVAMDFLYEVKGDDLIVNITFAWEQAIAIVKAQDEGALVSHRFPTYEFDRSVVVPEFFHYLMLTERFHGKLELITPGGAGRNRVMSKTDFLKLVVKVPRVREQQRISDVLQTNDQVIKAYQQYLDLLRHQKRGLIQQLLNGRMPVNVYNNSPLAGIKD